MLKKMMFLIFFVLFMSFFGVCDDGKVRFIVFISSNCEKCQDFIDLRIDPLVDELNCEYKVIDLSQDDGFEFFYEVTKNYPNSQSMLSVLIGEDYLSEREIEDRLKPLILKYQSAGGVDFAVSGESESIGRKSLDELTFLGTYGAGFLDGINPCAMSTLVFFVSYLLLVKASRLVVYQAGGVFILVTFVIYFCIGLGLFQVIEKLAFLGIVSRFLYGVMALILVVLAGVSFYDALLCLRGLSKKMILKLSLDQNQMIHQIVRHQLNRHSIMLATAVIASVIALVEFTCTGQIYFPLITYAVKHEISLIQSLFLLFVYNLGFITPLVITFFVIVKGGSALKFSKWFENKIVLVKIATGVFFIVLAIWLF